MATHYSLRRYNILSTQQPVASITSPLGTDIATIHLDQYGKRLLKVLLYGLAKHTDVSVWDVDNSQYIVGDAGQLAQEA